MKVHQIPNTLSRWRALHHTYTEELYRHITSLEADSAHTLEEFEAPKTENQEDVASRDLLAFARLKLVFSENTNTTLEESQKVSPLAGIAVLDVLLMFGFDSCRLSFDGLDPFKGMVSSNMRTVHSLTLDRLFMRSGYPSEPLLAEAAAQQIHAWRRNAKQDDGTRDPALEILSHNLNRDLLDRGELGEVICRYIIIMARFQASLVAYPNTSPHFSRPVPLALFLTELLAAEPARRFLSSIPNNSPDKGTNVPLKRCIEHAVVNFTHYAKWTDNEIVKPDNLLACFIRSLAPVCKTNARAIDLVIPFLVDRRRPVSPDNMSAILLQFKRRLHRGSPSKYAIRQEDVGMFDANNTDDHRPYLTVVMELGVTVSEDSISTNADRPRRGAQPEPMPKSIYIPVYDSSNEQGKKGKDRNVVADQQHARYSIFVYGCSPKTYKVVKDDEVARYQEMLQLTELLSNHPRKDEESKKLVYQQKPYFDAGSDMMYWFRRN